MTVRTVDEAIQSKELILDLYQRVHEELDEGKEWKDIDNGFRKEESDVTYELWSAYMQQRLINGLKDIVYTWRYHEKQKD